MPKIIENDDIPGIQHLIQRLAAEEGIAIYKLAERSGLHPTTLYAILKKKPGPHRRPVRRATIKALAAGLGYDLKFDPQKNQVLLEHRDQGRQPRNDVEELLDDIRRLLVRSGGEKITPELRGQILAVVRALVT
jgi:transcriptional regulator with XRE-family HTH domain